MDSKTQLTELVSKQLEWPLEPTSLKQTYKILWLNSRKKDKGGLRLTEEGYNIFIEKMDLKSYTINLPKELTLTNQTIIWLDHFINDPYYITKESIIVFKEKTAVQLMLFSGDVEKYGLAIAMSQHDSLDSQ